MSNYCICGHSAILHTYNQSFPGETMMGCCWSGYKLAKFPNPEVTNFDICSCNSYKQDNLKYLEQKYEETNK